MRVSALVFLGAVLFTTTGARADDDDFRAWAGVGGRNAIGPAYSDFGVYVMAGTWMAGEHVQPFARIGWSQGGGGATSLDAARLGAGIAVGVPLAHGHVWLGGAAAGEGMLVLSQDGKQSSWAGMVSLSVLGQLRVWSRFLVGVEAGPDFLPALVRSPNGALEWDAVRFNAGLRLGVILGRPN